MSRCFYIFLLLMLPWAAFAQTAEGFTKVEQMILTTASGQEINAERGQLMVLENRDDVSSTKIPITFVRLKSQAEEPISPVFYLEGGPGSSCTWMAESPEALERWGALLALGDVVLIDQRGTGAVGERMTWVNTEPLPEDLFISEKAANRHFVKMAPKAIEAFNKRNIDRDGYDTMESAKDIEALRKALGYNKISVLGFSYGTHLGQAYMKFFGEQIDKVILIGVEGLDETFKLPLRMDAQFRKLSAMVAADEVLGKDIPDLVALYQRVATKLTETPITLQVNSPLTREPMDVKLGKFGLDYLLFRDLGDASDLPVIPRLLYDVDQGNYDILTWFLQKRIGAGYGLHAMSVSMDIASGGSPDRLAKIQREAKESLFGNVMNTPHLALSKVWGIPDLGHEFWSGFTSSVPTLLLSGTLDMNTPPYQAERLRWSLPNAQHIIVQNAGHEQILTHPVIGPAIGKFLMGGDVSSVTATYPPLKFIPIQGERAGVWHPSLAK
ncbi:MAG: alpha/beta fold hydrolase [Bacteroidota bacterium]